MNVTASSCNVISSRAKQGLNTTLMKSLADKWLEESGLRKPHYPSFSLVSHTFKTEPLLIADRTETIVRGSRSLFHLLPDAFKGFKQIGIIGWGSQGPAQAQNLRESLEATNIRVKVGLRPGSHSFKLAEQHGFNEVNGTLGPMLDVIRESDLSILLISDAALAETCQEIFKAVQPGCYLGLSHGFLLAYLSSRGLEFPKHCGVIAVCPKGVGPSVRQLYEQGRSVNGAGINSSITVHQVAPLRADRENVDASVSSTRATDIALGWAVGIGSPVMFPTTLEAEYVSDLLGERGVLLGAIYGMCEALYRHFVHDLSKAGKEAHALIVGGITGPIAHTISREGLRGVASRLGANQSHWRKFKTAYTATYKPALEILAEIFEEVSSGREVLSIVDSTRRLKTFPFKSVDASPLWKHELSRTSSQDTELAIDPTVAGVYVAMMMAQCDLLVHMGHAYSEVANESIIEAVDSLIPYMKLKGIHYMIDNCSTTARIGARKWAPRFDYMLTQQVVPNLGESKEVAEWGEEADAIWNEFAENRIHEIWKSCANLRPPVDIVPQLTHLN